MPADNAPPSLTLPSELHMLSVARSFVEAACQAANLDRSLIHALVLATGEAFTNVIRHAHRHRPQAELRIECLIQPDQVEIRFHDQGEPFDLDSVPHLHPGELRIGGRGVYMMRRLMDELHCHPRPGGGNILRMVKYRSCAGNVRDCG
jgi:serine/threonine-protein kinase RsbW